MRLYAWLLILALPAAIEAQVTQRTPAAVQESGDFGSKFFDDLKSLFGRLQQSELERAFQRAKPIRCSDLVGQTGEWKEVAFLNDDRKLGDWHFESIEEVKRDLASFVFTGTCRNEEAPVKVVTSYPVEETFKQFADGKIPRSKIVINENDAVSVLFDAATNAYTFLLPYLYLQRRVGSEPLYTLVPPRLASKPESTVALEFRCKALSDAQLTYRFLLCRTRVNDRGSRAESQSVRQTLGNAAYYILSDGKEASSSVKLTFGADADTAPEPAAAPPIQPDVAAVKPTWTPASPQARLVDIGQQEFRLHFNSQTWNGRIEKPQLLSAEVLSDFVAPPKAVLNKAYCVWRPASASLVKELLGSVDPGTTIHSLGFRKELQSVISATFEIQNDQGLALGVLQCSFPESQTPGDVTVARWTSIVGKHLGLEIK